MEYPILMEYVEPMSSNKFIVNFTSHKTGKIVRSTSRVNMVGMDCSTWDMNLFYTPTTLDIEPPITEEKDNG